MERYDLYRDIATRTGGDIYIGVVGPVRTGKSTFIRKVMELMVLPAIEDGPQRERMVDEVPQSGAGKTIMTTQPHFVPNEAAKIEITDNVTASVRLIDCVGYMVDGALGQNEGDTARLVRTPWSEEDMPFEQAAAIGTRKVIEEHSTIGVVVTTDGSITGIARQAYMQPEEQVIQQLQQREKPFVILLNTTHPKDVETRSLRDTLQKKYNVPVLAINIANMQAGDLQNILESVLMEFPIRTMQVRMPDWVQALPSDHWLLEEIIATLGASLDQLERMHDYTKVLEGFGEAEYADPIQLQKMSMGEGTIDLLLPVKRKLFYEILGESCGCTVESDYQMLTMMEELMVAKREYDRLSAALDSVARTGYGVVAPATEELTLDEPQIVRHGNRYGVRLRANAPSLHLMRVDIQTEVSPIVGTEKESEELVNYLLSEFENDPKMIWTTNIFGKSLHELVQEGLSNKLNRMPDEARDKIQHTLQRIINEGSGGLICILL